MTRCICLSSEVRELRAALEKERSMTAGLLADIEKQAWKAEANFDENLKGVLERCAEAIRQSAAPASEGEQCMDCGRDYEIVYRVPDDVWAQIAPQKDTLGDYPEHQYGGLLCPDCAFAKARCLGIHLYFDGCVGDWPERAAPASADADAVELRGDLHEFWEHLPDKNEEAAELFGRLDAALAKLDAKKGEGL